MRLYKKAAACLLAAAMAVSMMTACGGAVGGGTGNGNGSSSTIESVPQPDDIILPSESGDKGDDSETKKIPIVNPSTSKYATFAKKISSSEKYYTKIASATYDANGSKVADITKTIAYNGSNDSTYLKEVGAASSKKIDYAMLEKITKDGYLHYYLFASDKAALFKGVDTESWLDSNFATSAPTVMYQSTATVRGKKYYTESFTDMGGTECIVCFSENGYPVYQFIRHETGYSDTAVYQDIQIGTDKNLTQLKDYSVYTEDYDDNGDHILTDTNGKTYAAETKYGPFHSPIGISKVIDESGNDVTQKFNWYVKLYSQS